VNYFDEKPRILPVNGLSKERQKYLFKSIRPYVKTQYQGILTPKPDLPEKRCKSTAEKNPKKIQEIEIIVF